MEQDRKPDSSSSTVVTVAVTALLVIVACGLVYWFWLRPAKGAPPPEVVAPTPTPCPPAPVPSATDLAVGLATELSKQRRAGHLSDTLTAMRASPQLEAAAEALATDVREELTQDRGPGRPTLGQVGRKAALRALSECPPLDQCMDRGESSMDDLRNTIRAQGVPIPDDIEEMEFGFGYYPGQSCENNTKSCASVADAVQEQLDYLKACPGLMLCHYQGETAVQKLQRVMEALGSNDHVGWNVTPSMKDCATDMAACQTRLADVRQALADVDAKFPKGK